MNTPALVTAHYGTTDLVTRVAQTLTEAGLGEGIIDWRTLGPLDQFHAGGAAATAALAEKLAITPGARVLDVGCGLGGPSRHLAATTGCTVEGVDLNAPFIDVATMLTARTGLAERVRHAVGDATRLDFEDASFDFAWTQHVVMNIADRDALYAGVYRVLEPGGRFAMFDIVEGSGEPLHFPVPWARDPAASSLLTMDATRAVLEHSGFRVLDWTDATDLGREWQEAQAGALQSRPEHLRPIFLPLVMGSDFPSMVANLGRNLMEGRVKLLQAIVEKPA